MRRGVLILGLAAVLATAGFLYGKMAWERVLAYFQPGEEDPVPTLRVRKQDYVVSVTASGEMTGFDTQTVAAPMVQWEGSMKVAAVAEEGTIVQPGDVLVKIDSTAAAQSLVQKRNTVRSFETQISRSGKDAETEARVMEYDRRLAEAGVAYADSHVRRDPDIFSKWEIQESILSAALARYRKENQERKGGVREELSRADRGILEIQRNKARARVTTVEEALSSMVVKAPIEGVIFHLAGWMSKLRAGAEVWPGQPLVEIASLRHFQGKLGVLETDITGIAEGTRVRATLDALPDVVLAGKVTRMGKVAEPLTEDDPRKFFTCGVTWDVDPGLLARLKPGLRFRAEIEVAVRRGAVVLPRCAVVKKDSAFTVFVKGGPKGYTERTVTLRDGDHGFFVVEGLREGEKVCLRHPFEKQKLRLPSFNAPSTTSSRRVTIRIG